MRTWIALGLVASLAASAAVPGEAAAASEAEPSVTGVAHELVHRDGEFVLTDGLFDATGPDLDGLHFDGIGALLEPVQEDVSIAVTHGVFGSQRLTRAGDFQLPLDRSRWPDFTSDLAELRVAYRAGRVAVRFTFNSMPSPDAQLATLVVAPVTDAPMRPWPAEAGVSSPWTTAVTMGGTHAEVEHPGGSNIVATEVSGHSITATLDASHFPPAPWLVTAGTGLADPGSPDRYWSMPLGPAGVSSPGSGGGPTPVAIWDLAQAGQHWAPFGDRQQAELLASGNLAAAAFRMDPPRPRGIPAAGSGTLARTFTSRFDGGDGLQRDFSGVLELGAHPPGDAPFPDPGPGTGWVYTGRLQHYGVHLPSTSGPSSRAPLVIWLHGSGGEADDLYEEVPDLVAALAGGGYLIATPLGRGDTFYRTGPGELDVLEVLADVSRHYSVDVDRVYLAGFSGGAAGVYALGSRYPHLFAGLLPVTATYEDPALIDNLAQVPWLGIAGGADPTSVLLDGTGLYQALSDRGADAALVSYVAKTHEFSLIYDSVGWILDFLDSHRRPGPPPRVTWVSKAGDDRPDLGLTRGGTWWLSDITPTDPTAGTRTVAETWGLGVRPPSSSDAMRTEELVDRGGRSGRTLARFLRTTPGEWQVVPRTNRLELAVTNVSSLTVDLRAAGLSIHGLVVHSTVDTPVALRLVDGHRTAILHLLPGGQVVETPGLLPL